MKMDKANAITGIGKLNRATFFHLKMRYSAIHAPPWAIFSRALIRENPAKGHGNIFFSQLRDAVHSFKKLVKNNATFEQL